VDQQGLRSGAMQQQDTESVCVVSVEVNCDRH